MLIEMRIVFRTDASIQIGTGHVMRCLTLAEALKARGVKCSFVCRPHVGHLLELIGQHGHEVIALPTLQNASEHNNKSTSHLDWLGIDWMTDAIEVKQALHFKMGNKPVDWLILDHYALSSGWEQEMSTFAARTMVIDDLADRSHRCDILLDQNLGRTAQDYNGLLSSDTLNLIGPQYAMLRPEFAENRQQSLQRRADSPHLKHLLISMGGVDTTNATGKVLEALKRCALPSDFRITVVMGKHSPWLEQVVATTKSMPKPTEVMVGISNMAKIMADSDLSIGAAGGMAWERCCIGLPSIVMVLAKNQFPGAMALQNVGAAIVIQTINQLIDLLNQWQLQRSTSAILLKLSQEAAAVTDGNGCARVAEHLLARTHA